MNRGTRQAYQIVLGLHEAAGLNGRMGWVGCLKVVRSATCPPGARLLRERERRCAGLAGASWIRVSEIGRHR